MHRAGKVLGIEPLPLHPLRQGLIGLGHHLHQGQPIAPFQGGAQGIGEALLDPLAGHQPVDHHLDVMGMVLVELDVVGQLPHLAIDPDPGESLRHQPAQQLHVGALLAPHQRSQKLIAGAFGQGEDLVDHLIDGLGSDGALALGAVGFTGTAVEEPQIVLDLRDRADGGAGVVAGGFLVDRDGGGEPLDGIHIGLVDLAQELAGVGGKALHVTPLTLREDRVEGEGTLAAAADPGEHHHPVAGDGEVDVAEIVLAGSPDPDHILQAAAVEALEGRAFGGGWLWQGGGSRALAFGSGLDAGAGHPEMAGTVKSTNGPRGGWGRAAG
jgi:hypothetical protein